MKYCAILFVYISFSFTATAADIYRIVDENGRVHYSQIPPYKDAKK